MSKINSAWFTPKSFVSSFTGKYARKVIGQNLVQSAYQVTGNNIFAPMPVSAPTYAPKNMCPLRVTR